VARGKANGSTTGANLGFESKLWSMADSLRGSMDSADSGYPCASAYYSCCTWKSKLSVVQRRLMGEEGEL
jgi:type I restriction-modification system DNA methylase subunit